MYRVDGVIVCILWVMKLKPQKAACSVPLSVTSFCPSLLIAVSKAALWFGPCLAYSGAHTSKSSSVLGRNSAFLKSVQQDGTGSHFGVAWGRPQALGLPPPPSNEWAPISWTLWDTSSLKRHSLEGMRSVPRGSKLAKNQVLRARKKLDFTPSWAAGNGILNYLSESQLPIL